MYLEVAKEIADGNYFILSRKPLSQNYIFNRGANFRGNLANRCYVMHFVIGSTCDAISEIVFIPVVTGKYAHLSLFFQKNKRDSDRHRSN